MAGRRRSRRAAAKARRYGATTSYKFTARRRYALMRAQEISAKKRRGRAIRAAALVVGVGAGAYLGYRHRGTIKKTAKNWKNVVSPNRKEIVRHGNAVSVAHPSATTVITADARHRAQAERDRLALAGSAPRYRRVNEEDVNIGGRDSRIYDEHGNVDSEAMTQRSVKRTLAHQRKKTRGRRVASKADKAIPKTTKKSKESVELQALEQWIKDFGKLNP